MIQLNEMITIIVLLTFCSVGHLECFSLSRFKRATNDELYQRIPTSGNLIFNGTHVPGANVTRKFACLFVFDKEASADLNNNSQIANSYATQLATFASLYTAHANIIVTNAGVQMWSDADQISFTVENQLDSPLLVLLPRFQTYLDSNATIKALFGTVYTVGVLISNKGYPLVSGGFTQGPPNTTSGASIINYRPYPWSIAGLLAHELAHTLSVVHPFELEYLCEDCPRLPFCPSYTSQPIPDNCLCSSSANPPQQCLMTFNFGQAVTNAPRYTPCDIIMMNFFSSNASCY